ncbi:MAG: methyltransferase family protein [Thermocladium sp.]
MDTTSKNSWLAAMNLIYRNRSIAFLTAYFIAFASSYVTGSSIDEYLYIHGFSVNELRLFTLLFGLIGVMGFSLRVWAAGYLGYVTVHSRAIRTNELVTCGPYSHVRHPLYLGLILISLGFVPELLLPGLLLLMVINIILITILINMEETSSLSKYGYVYVNYRSSVPMLLPSLRARVQYNGFHFSLWGGLVTELGNIFVLSTLVAGVTLSGFYFSITTFTLLPLGFLFSKTLRGKLTSSPP